MLKRTVASQRLLLSAGLVLTVASMAAGGSTAAQQTPPGTAIGHIIVIVQENRSFDNLYGLFPGANGLANAGDAARQLDLNGVPYVTLPQPTDNYGKQPPFELDTRFPTDLPNAPYLMSKYVSPSDKHGDTWHRFYQEQWQIDGGKMDRYVAWSDNGGLVLGYWDITQLPMYGYASQYTLMDNFFHSAFGGSFLAHQWLICACTPKFPDAPPEMRAQIDPTGMLVKDGELAPDSSVVNTAYTSYSPHPSTAPPERLVKPLSATTIGDRLNDKGIDWAWYAGGWNDAIAGAPSPQFKFHHHPFTYYEQFGDGTEQKALHLKDEADFLAALQDGSLPAVAFVKPIGDNNQHPGYANVMQGELHLVDLLQAIEQSPVWKDSVVIVTYDENGGLWDHVPPPKVDEWGLGTRVPTIIISPLARRGFIDHTQAEHASILALIEWRFGLQPLGTRDAQANNLTQALLLPAP